MKVESESKTSIDDLTDYFVGVWAAARKWPPPPWIADSADGEKEDDENG